MFIVASRPKFFKKKVRSPKACLTNFWITKCQQTKGLLTTVTRSAEQAWRSRKWIVHGHKIEIAIFPQNMRVGGGVHPSLKALCITPYHYYSKGNCPTAKLHFISMVHNYNTKKWLNIYHTEWNAHKINQLFLYCQSI